MHCYNPFLSIDNLRQKGADNSDAFKKIAGLEKRLIRECDVRPGGSREVLHAMMPKSGDNWHVHISVSRRDITNTFSLSPNAKGRGSKNHVLNGQLVRVGFDREAYKIACEKNFDRMFLHDRLLTESYEQAKRLRKEGTFAYAKQLAKDKATRREERLAFRRAGLVGYQDYFGDLLSCESLDGRQLMQLKGFLARQLHAAIPSKSVDEWMELDLEELRSELASFDIEPQHLSGSYITESMAARIGDKSLEVAGLQGGYRPVTVSYRLLRRGIAMRQATDRRREAVDRWIDIYSDKWYRENYRFESIGTMQRMDTLQAQAAFLNKELGESVLLTSAQEHAADLERQLVRDFLASHWTDWKQETVGSYARMLFGQDGAEVRTLNAFENMARERLLPVEAQKHIETLAARCRVESLESLQARIVELQPQPASELTARLQTFMTERGETLRALKSVLADKSMPVFEKERQILRLALDDRDLYKSLSDLKRGILGVLERQCPDMRSDSLQKRLAELFKGLKEIQSEQKDRFDKAITAFLRTEVPDYRPLIEKQSQLERLIRELTPDAEKCSEQLIEARRAIERSLAPHTERIFVKKSQWLFGDSVQLKNEHAFLEFVEGKFTPEQAGRCKATLPEERVSLRKIVSSYLQIAKDCSWPDFYEWVRDNYQRILAENEIQESYFNVGQFIHNGSEWYGEGIYGNVLARSEDPTTRLQGKKLLIFELENIRQHPQLLSIVVHMIGIAIRTLVWEQPGRRGFIIYEEFAELMKIDVIFSAVLYQMQAIRKKGGSACIVLQNLDQLALNAGDRYRNDGGAAGALMKNIETTIFLAGADPAGFERYAPAFSEHDRQCVLALKNNYTTPPLYSSFYIFRSKKSALMTLCVSPRTFLAYQTEGEICDELSGYYAESGSMEQAIERYEQYHEQSS